MLLVLENTQQKTGIVNIYVEMARFINRGVVLVQKMDVGEQRKATMTFSSVVGGVKTVDRTKARCKVFIGKTNGPSKGAEV